MGHGMPIQLSSTVVSLTLAGKFAVARQSLLGATSSFLCDLGQDFSYSHTSVNWQEC